jgi:predicted Zn-dependent protease
VLDFDALQRPIKTASVWQVRQPLYATSKARWQRYQQYLKPLIAGTNRKISWDRIEMVTLPDPGWLNTGVDHYHQDDLDAAERQIKQLLHFLPEHAAANFILGLICLCRGQHGDGVALMEQALERCPWNRHWRHDLAQAYRLQGREQDAVVLLENRTEQATPPPGASADKEASDQLDYLFLSEEATC